MFKWIVSLILMLSLISCGGGGSSSNPDTPNQPPVEVTEPRVGLAIFGLLNARFPLNDAIDMLSVQSRPTFSFTNKTFGENTQNYITLVDTLKAQGKSPYVGIYAICGPCRIPRRDGRLVEFRKDLDINALNRALANDPRTQEDYRNFLIDLKQNLVSLYNDLEYDIYPELESNFDRAAQTVAVRIAKEVFADSPNVRIVVNPLSNQRHANEPLEIHTDWPGNLSLVGKGDIINLDGSSFRFPGENGSGLSFDATKQFVTDAVNKGVIFYLWRFEWQGLTPGAHVSPDPDQRNYIFPNKDLIKELLQL